MKLPTLIISKLKINRGGKFLGFGLSPETDWKIILITFVIFLVFVLTGCAYYFILVSSGGFVQTNEEDKIPTSTFNINRVRQTINYYEGKSKELDKIKTTPENILDPSL